jgi:hypothetical protein
MLSKNLSEKEGKKIIVVQSQGTVQIQQNGPDFNTKIFQICQFLKNKKLRFAEREKVSVTKLRIN